MSMFEYVRYLPVPWRKPAYSSWFRNGSFAGCLNCGRRKWRRRVVVEVVVVVVVVAGGRHLRERRHARHVEHRHLEARDALAVGHDLVLRPPLKVLPQFLDVLRVHHEHHLDRDRLRAREGGGVLDRRQRRVLRACRGGGGAG